MKMIPASIWQLPELRQCAHTSNAMKLFTVAFNQCCWKAPYRKPTRLLTNLSTLRTWGPLSWPSFDSDGQYQGPAKNLCSCQPTVSLARAPDDDSFRTTATSIYPELMDRAIAKAILHDLSSHPSSSKEGGAVKRDADSFAEPQKKRAVAVGGATLDNKATLSNSATLSKSSKAVGGGAALSNSATLSNNATLSNSTGNASVVETLLDNKATLCSGKATLGKGAGSSSGGAGGRPGLGPPMQVKYKGELRSIHDGAGLCSPGRWPVGRRTAPSTEDGKELARWCFRAFEDWIELEGEEKAKKLFWQAAAGRSGGTPFGGEIFGFRERLDLWLRERGERPDRRPKDRNTEINFRRLMAVARVLEDEDSDFLDAVAEKGVPLGVVYAPDAEGLRGEGQVDR